MAGSVALKKEQAARRRRQRVLKRMDASFTRLKRTLEQIAAQMRSITQKARESRVLAAQTCNVYRGDGSERPWRMVLFPDGSDPTAVPHNLPALYTYEGIRRLKRRQLHAYLEGYGCADLHPSRHEREMQLVRAVGGKLAN